MNYYLIDASAFIYAIENLGKTKKDFFTEKSLGQAFLYMPQFCVTEVFNVYAKFFHRFKKITTSQEYEDWRKYFIQLIHRQLEPPLTNENMIYCYDLHRYHNLNAQEIYEVEHTTPYSAKESSLSSFDILVIAMGMELKKIHEPNSVIILTRDGRLKRISNMRPNFATAEWFE